MVLFSLIRQTLHFWCNLIIGNHRHPKKLHNYTKCQSLVPLLFPPEPQQEFHIDLLGHPIPQMIHIKNKE